MPVAHVVLGQGSLKYLSPRYRNRAEVDGVGGKVVEQSFRVRKARSVGDWQGVHRASEVGWSWWEGGTATIVCIGEVCGRLARSPQGDEGWQRRARRMEGAAEDLVLEGFIMII